MNTVQLMMLRVKMGPIYEKEGQKLPVILIPRATDLHLAGRLLLRLLLQTAVAAEHCWETVISVFLTVSLGQILKCFKRLLNLFWAFLNKPELPGRGPSEHKKGLCLSQ